MIKKKGKENKEIFYFTGYIFWLKLAGTDFGGTGFVWVLSVEIKFVTSIISSHVITKSPIILSKY